jgi:hypothetical protein
MVCKHPITSSAAAAVMLCPKYLAYVTPRVRRLTEVNFCVFNSTTGMATLLLIACLK